MEHMEVKTMSYTKLIKCGPLMLLFALVLITPLRLLADKVPVADMKRVIGIVELPAIFGLVDPEGPPGSRLHFSPTPVSVYMQPGGSPRLAAVIKTDEDIVTAEYGYELEGALVYAKKAGWYRIGIETTSGPSRMWLRATDAGRYYPLTELLKNSLAFLTRHWDRHLADLPGTKAKRYNIEARDIRVINTRLVKNNTWFLVEVLHPARCEGPSPKVVARGWMPAYNTNGSMNAWFYSRGC